MLKRVDEIALRAFAGGMNRTKFEEKATTGVGWSRSRRWMWTSLLVMAIAQGMAAATSGVSADSSKQEGDVELRGRVVCIPEEMNRLYGADLPTGHAHLYGFKTAEGTVFTLLRTKNSEAFFADERVRAKELIVRGRLFPGTCILDATPLRTVREGKIYDLYYWCDICAIKTVVPGECMCCQKQVELTETPTGALD